MEKFIELLKKFDWYYEMSDGHRVWERGCQAEAALNRGFNLVKAEFGEAKAIEVWNQHCHKDFKKPVPGGTT